MPSLRDVATAARVSVATVSHVVNGTRYVSPELTARVRRAMQDLDYSPNWVARSLRTQRTQTIGFITSDITNPFYTAVAKGAMISAARQGYSLVLCDVGETANSDAEIVLWLLQRQVDGLLFTSAHMDSPVIAHLDERAYPYVLINRRVPGIESDYLGLDNEGGTSAAVAHLAGLGHRVIAFINGIANSSAAAGRLSGFLNGMESARLAVDPGLIYQGDYCMESGYAAARHFLETRPDVTAIVAGNDLMGFGAWQFLHQIGVQVPREMSIVGFDDIPLASMAPIQLTTISCPQYEMGAGAVQMLLNRFAENGPRTPREIILPVQLVVRETTAQPRDRARI